MESTYQFSCPSCSALLQAVLKQALTSVQCGECFDVFDVQMPAAYVSPTCARRCPAFSALLWVYFERGQGHAFTSFPPS